MDGILRCSRYSFGPNRLHYCGPDANQELLAYMKEGAKDAGLRAILRAFETLYPSLQLIAASNRIADPFDERVVEAYWIGNSLLEQVEQHTLYQHLVVEKKLKKKIGGKLFAEVEHSVRQGALPHHSFQVLDVWRRTSGFEHLDMIERMDACRIASGVVTQTEGPFVHVEIEPLTLRHGKLAFGKPETRKVTRTFEANVELENLAPGDIVSVHWGVVCEKITKTQAETLKKYTQRHIELANHAI